MLEKLKEMSRMQKALDESIEKEYNLVYGKEKYTLEGLKRALLDELGELNHELKADWCWWKKTQAPVNRDNVLEELVDVWHFALAIDYHENEEVQCNIRGARYEVEFASFTDIVQEMLIDEGLILTYMYAITLKLGFEFDDVYQEYKRKNSVNYTRLRMGY